MRERRGTADDSRPPRRPHPSEPDLGRPQASKGGRRVRFRARRGSSIPVTRSERVLHHRAIDPRDPDRVRVERWRRINLYAGVPVLGVLAVHLVWSIRGTDTGPLRPFALAGAAAFWLTRAGLRVAEARALRTGAEVTEQT